MRSLKNKTVLITGGTGSFGQAFTKQILELKEAKNVIVFAISIAFANFLSGVFIALRSFAFSGTSESNLFFSISLIDNGKSVKIAILPARV